MTGKNHESEAGCSKCGAGPTLDTNNGNFAWACKHIGDNNFYDGDPQGSSVALLRSETDSTLRFMAGHLTLPTPGGNFEVERELFHELVSAEGNFLLTGDPGAGKTALICKLAQHYRDRGHKVVLLDASNYVGRVSSQMALNLETVLADWEGEGPGHLLIDALDGDRAGMAEQLIRTVEQVAESGWRTVASVRLYDITHNQRWRKAFAGAPVAAEGVHRVKALEGVRHFRVTGLTGTELARVGIRVPGLGRVLTGSDNELLSNPFNLSLACELLNAGAWLKDWNGHLDQSVLLTHYWNQRVMNRGRFSRMKLLRELCRLMLSTRQLQVSQADVATEHVKELSDLVSNGVLQEIAPRYVNAVPSLAFGHHIFFDYAVSQLIFSDGDGSLLVRLLNDQPNLVFVARPAIDLHLTATWHADSTRELFAEVCRGLARAEHDLAGVAAANIAVGLARNEEDVDWLVSALLTGEENTTEQVVDWVIGVLRGREGRDADSRREVVRVWTSVATALAQRLGSTFRAKPVNLLYQLLQRLHEIDPFGPEAETALERAECVAALMSAGLEDTVGRAQVVTMASRHLSAAIAVSSAHADLLRRVIQDEPTRRRNHDVFSSLVHGSVDIAHSAPEAAAELLETVWDLKGSRDEMTVMNEGVIPLNSNLAQDFEQVRYQVGQVFPRVLPLIGVEAACRVLGHATRTGPAVLERQGDQSALLVDGASGTLSYGATLLEEVGEGAGEKMVDALLDWAEQTGVDGVQVVVRHLVLQVGHVDIWKRVLERAQGKWKLWRPTAIELLSSGALLANQASRAKAAELMRALSAHTGEEEHKDLEEAVLAASAIVAPEGGEWAVRVIDELVPYLRSDRLTRQRLIERRQVVDQMENPPEPSFDGVICTVEASSSEERYGVKTCEELGEERLARIVDLEKLTQTLGSGTEWHLWNRLGRLFLETVSDDLLRDRLTAGPEDRVGLVMVGAANALTRFKDATPGSEIGREVFRVLLLAVAQKDVDGPESDGEGGES